MQKATITITDIGEENIDIKVEFDPPLNKEESSYVSHLAITALNAIVEETNGIVGKPVIG